MFTYINAFHLTMVLLFFIYQFIIRGCFHKYIPSMLTRMSAGIAFALLSCIVQLLTKIYPSYESLLIIKQTITGISGFLILPTSFEFTVAQSPEYMRGIMVGLCYTSVGAGYAFAAVVLYYLKLSLYYYIIVCFLHLLLLIVFVILARRYKYRVRENEVNIVQIVDDHYQRYMEQEDEYERHQEIPESEIIIIEH
uniref:Major facilitator superfamily (MFS) profile domain-containing protein n=1 Tax=Amphimedon queenslandica TaxID=400682 RepID=A0A1X7SRH8_AMPQE